MSEGPRAVLSVGTMEARGIVGLGLDLRLLGARGIPSHAVVAAISAQGPGIHEVVEAPCALIDAQFASIDPEFVGAIRVGALPSIAAIDCVVRNLARFSGVPIVVDPVSISSRGGHLALEDTTRSLSERLIPISTIALPNLDEVRALTAIEPNDDDSIVRAARALVARGARAVLVTGGHGPGDPTDVLVDRAREPVRFTAPRLDREMRGTGCVLAVSLAAELSLTMGEIGAPSLELAIERARTTVRTTIAHARRVGDQWVA